MAETRPYRVLKGKHGRWVDGQPVTYRPGDTMHLTEAQACRMTSATGSMVEPLWVADEPAAEAKPEPAPEPAPEPEAKPADPDFAAVLEGNLLQVREHVATVNDPAELQALRDAETAGKNRSGALNVIGERLAELEG